jgi:hypothetical protein
LLKTTHFAAGFSDDSTPESHLWLTDKVVAYISVNIFLCHQIMTFVVESSEKSAAKCRVLIIVDFVESKIPIFIWTQCRLINIE